jgi:hypothetical protein
MQTPLRAGLSSAVAGVEWRASANHEPPGARGSGVQSSGFRVRGSAFGCAAKSQFKPAVTNAESQFEVNQRGIAIRS